MLKHNLLITGGSGYVGTRLINILLRRENINKIINYDVSFYGDNHLPNNKKLVYCKKDIRDKASFQDAIRENNINTVIHLACISNDPTFELNSDISKQINFDCFENLVSVSKASGVINFIYASTCSVYGVSETPDVNEESPLVPITDYNKYKAECEPILKKYIDNNFSGVIIRPATVCGYSEKMRFDLTVNILTNYAYNKGFIKVFGGEQYRPNIHIDDMCNLYLLLLNTDLNKINGEIFNAGHQNLKVIEIANKVKKITEKLTDKNIEIRVEKSNDIRSYQINSDKIQQKLDYKFNKSVEDAITDLIMNFKNNNIIDSFNPKWQNLSILKNLELNNFEL